MLEKKQYIGSYIITFPIKEGAYAETYRVKDSGGKNYFLKLIYCSKLHPTQIDDEGNVLELEIAKQLIHPNITKYHDSGEMQVGGERCVYIVFDFIVGETVSQKTTREQRCSVYDAKQIVMDVLTGLKFLHHLERPVIHNEITIQNTMLDMSGTTDVAKIIDFGYARYQDQPATSFMKEGLNPLCMAPETLGGEFSVQSDIYSVGVMLYQLVFGMFPYYVDTAKYSGDQNALEAAILEAHMCPLSIPNGNLFELDEQTVNIMSKAMAFNKEERFQSVEEFMKALNGKIHVDPVTTITMKSGSDQGNAPYGQAQGVHSAQPRVVTPKVGNGFKDVAGMTELKEQLQSDVIDMLNNPEQAKELGITMPNGILFYGPPGCGKTFFAEKFAEEAGFNYKYIKCSDIASPYIHGGQDKIAAIFDDARHNSPTILFFDEIDAMIMDRSKQQNVSESGEVNEFLAQLNNCGESGVLVIGATNKPSEIDEAALRSGRLEMKYYIPMPDAETRASIFEINLKTRKCEENIDYKHLAELTENYISADIKMIVDKSARLTFRRKEEKITQTVIEEVINSSKPSLSLDVIRKHEAIRDKFQGVKPESSRNHIGFK